MKRTSTVTSLIVVSTAIVTVITAALFTAEYIATNPDLQMYIAQFGYVGVTVLAIIAGLNVILPIPAASLTPVFVSAGLYLPGIILALTIGTVIADLIGHRFGRWSSVTIKDKYPKLVAKLTHIYTHHKQYLIPVIFLYAAFVPFPNEAIVVPLAVLGVRFRIMVLPLFVGNLVNQGLYAYGVQGLFWWLF